MNPNIFIEFANILTNAELRQPRKIKKMNVDDQSLGLRSVHHVMPLLTLPSCGMVTDLRGLIANQVIPALEGQDPTPLTLENVKSLPSGLQGVYFLTYRGEDVFLGVADQSRDMRKRLLRDYHEVQHRHGVDPTAVGFRAVQWLIK